MAWPFFYKTLVLYNIKTNRLLLRRALYAMAIINIRLTDFPDHYEVIGIF